MYPLLNHHACLRKVLEIPLENLRRATMHFNELPPGQRLPVMRVFLQGIPIGQVTLEVGISFMDLTGRVKDGLMALMKFNLTQESS